ncbi:MAG: hypothetical protein ABIN18_22380 [Pseudomonadota bacterium]
MKIQKLHIENIRGIREGMDLEPGGKNYVIFGPNGTGKSAVVDALDFLFTGDIKRLRGEGTYGISPTKHGPHIDSKPEDTIVRASIKIPGSDDIFELERSLSDPGKLVVLKGDEKKISDALQIAMRGHHVLCRRDIMNYIASKKGERAKEIQALLNLERIERFRQFFGNAEFETKRETDSLMRQFNTARGNICHYLEIPFSEFSKERVLDEINKFRDKLGGSEIKEVDENTLKKDLKVSSIGEKKGIISPKFIKSNINKVRELLEEESELIRKVEKHVISELRKIKTDKNLKKELQNLKLLEFGISLLDESGKCPLCEKEWEPSELKKKLESRLLTAKEAKKLNDEIEENLEHIKSKYSELKDALVNIKGCLDLYKLKELKTIFSKWEEEISSYLLALENAEDNIDIIESSLKKGKMFVPDKHEEISEKIKEKADTEGEKLTEVQEAWDTLSKLDPLIRGYKKARIDFIKADRISKRAEVIRGKYEVSKDKVLNDLYDRIKNDFVEYYKFVHGEDEKTFEADIEAKGSELNLLVDFYGRGRFPPLTFHSEGHQDSMGVCLYLALIKLISEEKVLLTVLDDVVMSIDSSHRKKFAKLLIKYFPDRQFLITTHDTTWAKQLNTEGIVNKKNMREFQNWHLDTGPIYEANSDMWKRIEDHIKKNNIPSAAHTLRLGSEFFFGQICDNLEAKTIHKCDSQHDLGDLLPAAVSRYKEILGKAKLSANSWNKREDVAKLSEIESSFNQVYVRSQGEQWGINANVHFSKLSNFTREDFKPIAEAFKDLYGFFICGRCGSILHVTKDGKDDRNLRCNCEYVNWNLVPK